MQKKVSMPHSHCVGITHWETFWKHFFIYSRKDISIAVHIMAMEDLSTSFF
ncbi:MAG TPA: hypothetical protein VKR53_05315 [Puia sp.]|nr:hypothetical protein [Puia sp.]